MAQYQRRPTWAEVKASALAERRDRLSGKILTIVTSFTDSQPLHGWDNVHAIREIWQNFRDGLLARFGPDVTMHRGGNHLYEARQGDRVVGRLDCTMPDRFQLTQHECILPIDCLDLATTKHSKDSIGGHGEGFKLGINLLLCQGFRVEYRMAYERWTFALRHARSARHNNMCVDIETVGDSDALEITIRGPGAHEMFDAKMDLDLYLPQHQLACDGGGSGQILTADNGMHGRVYCRRLFVGIDPELQALHLGVNLNLPVARDRHLVPNGTWLAIQAMLEGVCAAHRGRAASKEALARAAPVFAPLLALLSSGTQQQFSKQVPFVKPALRSYCAIMQGVANEKQVIFLDQPADSTLQVLREIGYTAIHPAGALADAFDPERLTSKFIDEAPTLDEARLPERALRCLTALRSLIGALALSVDVRAPTVHVKALSRAIAAYVPQVYRDRNFRIVIDVTLIDSDDELAYCAQECSRALMRDIANFYDQSRLVSRITADFIRRPHSFEVRKYRIPTAADQAPPAAASPASPPPASAAKTSGAIASASSVRHPNAPGAATTATTHEDDWAIGTSAHDLAGLQAAANMPPAQLDFASDPHPPIPDRDGAGGRACSSFDGVLFPLEFPAARGALVVHVDSTKLDQLTALLGGNLVAALASALPAIVAATQQVQANIARSMPQPFAVSDVPITYVAVRPTLLGFTQRCHVYLNVVPLVMARHEGAALRQEIFFTLAHELAHRRHRVHDTHFADTLAKLIYTLRNCV